MNLSVPPTEDYSTACYETWYNDGSVSWEEFFNIEEPKIAAVSKWPPLKEGYPPKNEKKMKIFFSPKIILLGK